MGTGEYWGAVEMQLCFHMEFRPCWSLSVAHYHTPVKELYLCLTEWC